MIQAKGSGNFMVDQEEQQENKKLDCGCKRVCTCDEGDE